MDDDYKDPHTYKNTDVDTAKGRNKDTIKWIAYIVAAGVAVPILALVLSFNAGAAQHDEAQLTPVADDAVIVAAD